MATRISKSLFTDTTNQFLLPTGTLLDFAGTSAPTGFLLCDGSAINRTTYAALFAVIGTTWGSGNGSTTFNLPDFRRRVAVGSGGTGTGTLGSSTGNSGGAETHTLSTAELASHTHTGSTGNENASHVHGEETSGHYNNGYSGRQVVSGAGVYCDLPNVDGGQFYTGGQTSNHQHSFTTAGNGSSSAHNNIQPSVVVSKIIKI